MTNDHHKNWFLFIFIALTLYGLTRHQLFDIYTINNDASQHLVWLNQWDGFSSFDETIPFSKLIQPIGFKVMTATLSHFLTVHQLTLLLDFIKCAILFFIASALSNKWFDKGVLRYLFFGALYISACNKGGVLLSRSFASLFILLSVYLETIPSSKKNIPIAINLLLSSITYPPAFVIISSFHLLLSIKSHRFTDLWYSAKQKKIVIGVILLGFLWNLSYSQQISDNELAGKMIDKAFILKDPHAGDKGRVHLRKYWVHPIEELVKISADEVSIFLPVNTSKIPFFVGIFTCFLLVLIIGFAIKNSNISITALILSGFILYAAAILLPFKLFIPKRYPAHTLYFGIFIFMGISKSLPWHKYKITTYILTLALLFALYNGLQFKENDYSPQRSLFEYCEQHIPPGSMIVTNDINLSNMIPYFSNRSVFVSREHQHAIYFENYRNRQDEKMQVWNEIFSTDSIGRLKQLFKEHHIDYLILKPPYFKIANKRVHAPHTLDIVKKDNAMKDYLNDLTEEEIEVGTTTLKVFKVR
jgi:hypothetical protein